MKALKKFLIIFFILLAIYTIVTTRKMMIVIKLVEKSEEYVGKTNYFAVVQSIQNGNTNVIKSYNKDGNYLSIMSTYKKKDKNESVFTQYKKDSEEIGIIQSGEKKIAMLKNDALIEVNVVNIFSTFDTTVKKLQLAIMSKITTENYGNSECYLVELDNWKMWVDKNTGLIIREINGGFITERFYEFDVVKDEDIIKPNIEDCKIQE